jgi:hypothetical protein
MKRNHLLAVLLGGMFAAIATVAHAKLPAPPAPTEEQKAKAAEAKEKAAESAKKDAADLGRYQDRAAARFFADAKAAGKTVPPSTYVPPAPVAVAAAQPSSSEAHGQKQASAPKTQSAGTPAAAKKAGTDAKPTPAKG